MKKVFVAAALVLGTLSFSACESKKADGEGGDTTSTMTEPMTTEPMTDTTMAPADTTTAPADSSAN